MKGLLLAIQAELRGMEGIRNSDIFLAADLDLVPTSVKFPCIGIKGGRVKRSDAPGGVTILTLPVEIYLYQLLSRGDETVISMLDNAETIQVLLRSNYLDGYVQDVVSGDESPIQLIPRDTRLVLKKVMNFQYEREEA